MTILRRPPKGRGAPRARGGIPFTRFDRGWTHCICVASGPSLTQDQIDQIATARPQWKVLVTNNTWERIPTADVLYAGDEQWWEVYGGVVHAAFSGEKWTGSRRIAHRDSINFVQVRANEGLSRTPGLVHSGSNSGYQMLNLAYLFGARRVLLVGYDMGKVNGLSHWHGDHAGVLNQQMPFDRWRSGFNLIAADLAADGVIVHNCSTRSALTCFPTGNLNELIAQSTDRCDRYDSAPTPSA